jgi:DNA polymerase III delta' subunit
MDITINVSKKIKQSNPSFIFTGIKGTGKKHTAIEVAKNVICNQTPACQTCSECTRIERQIHPDIVLVEPLEGDKEIKIESIRELIKSLNFSSTEGGKRIVIIDEAHRMNKSSANALLKTLEEPPKDTSFILLSSNLYAMPATIISRCELVRFAPMDKDKMASLANIPTDHPFIPYAQGSISALSFLLANKEAIEKFINFLNDPIDSYKIVNKISTELLEAISSSTKPQELENIEYIFSIIIYSILKRSESEEVMNNTFFLTKIQDSIEEINKISKKIYLNTPASIILENILLEVIQCQKNLLK